MDLPVAPISVVMPTFDRFQTTLKSIRTVVEDQRVKELWVLDDGSQRQHFERIKQFCQKQPKIHFIASVKNEGFAGNFLKCLEQMKRVQTPYVFLCESDMLLVKGWGQVVSRVFEILKETIALSPMLHKDQIELYNSIFFEQRCLRGIYKEEDGRRSEIQKPFGSKCFTQYPNSLEPVKMGDYKIAFAPNGCICSMIFRSEFFKQLDITQAQPQFGDAWLSYQCYQFNRGNPRTMATIDPGLALTVGEKGINPETVLHNVRWAGSMAWKYKPTAFLLRLILKLKYVTKRKNLKTGDPSYLDPRQYLVKNTR